MTLSGCFAVHELFSEGESPSCNCHAENLYVNEAVGMDLLPDDDGVWRHILQEENGAKNKGWAVSAGPIEHRGISSPSRGGCNR